MTANKARERKWGKEAWKWIDRQMQNTYNTSVIDNQVHKKVSRKLRVFQFHLLSLVSS